MNFRHVHNCESCGVKITPFVRQELFIKGIIRPVCRACYKQAIINTKIKKRMGGQY
jgi:hypothetical protein